MAERLVILGAGGFCREIISMVRSSCLVDKWDIVGLLDDDENRRGATVSGIPVLGPISAMSSLADAWAVCSIGDPLTRWETVRRVETTAGVPPRWATIVDPTVWIGERCSIGAGSVLCRGACFTCDVTVGRHVHVNCNSAAGHDAALGDFVTLASHVDICGGARIGACVYVGAGGRVLPGIELGYCAQLGAGSVAYRGLEPRQVAVGVPAQRVKTVAIPPELDSLLRAQAGASPIP